MTRTLKRRRFKKNIRGGTLNEIGTAKEVNELPSTMSNIKKLTDIGLQLGNNIAAKGINYMEDGIQNAVEYVGIDPNASVNDEIQKIGNKLGQVKYALESPAGQMALNNMQDVASEFSEKIIGPSVNKVVESVADNSGPIINKSVKAVLDGISATPIGPIVEIPRFLGDIGGIVEDSTAMAADVINIGKNAFEQGQAQTNKFQDAWNDLQNVVQSANQTVSNKLDSIQDKFEQVPPLKKYQQEAMMIGGRTNKSQMEFLYGSTNQLKMRGKHSRKRKNKKRVLTYKR